MLQQKLKDLKATINSLKLFKSLKAFTPKKMRNITLIIEWNFKDQWAFLGTIIFLQSDWIYVKTTLVDATIWQNIYYDNNYEIPWPCVVQENSTL